MRTPCASRYEHVFVVYTQEAPLDDAAVQAVQRLTLH